MAEYETKRTGLVNNYDLWSAGNPENIPEHQGAEAKSAKKFNSADHAKELDGRAAAKRPSKVELYQTLLD